MQDVGHTVQMVVEARCGLQGAIGYKGGRNCSIYHARTRTHIGLAVSDCPLDGAFSGDVDRAERLQTALQELQEPGAARRHHIRSEQIRTRQGDEVGGLAECWALTSRSASAPLDHGFQCSRGRSRPRARHTHSRLRRTSKPNGRALRRRPIRTDIPWPRCCSVLPQ